MADRSVLESTLMGRRTYASVTEEECTCRYLDNAANDPENPISFHQETAEYQFRFTDGVLIIYHCPFCGGAAPASKRSCLFATIPPLEEERLANLLDGIDTIAAAVQRLGRPDSESLAKTVSPNWGDRPHQIEHHKRLEYRGLSDVANVEITERPDGKIHWYLQGKYIGPHSA